VLPQWKILGKDSVMKKTRILWKIVDGVLFLGVAGMLATVILQVISRIAGHSVPWTEEVTRNLFVLTVFFGLSVGFRRVEHARMTFVLRFFPAWVQKAQLHLYFVGGALLFGVVTRQALRIVVQQFRSGEMSPASGIPMYVVSLPVLVGAVLSLIGIFQSVYLDSKTQERLLHEEEEGLAGADDLSNDGAPQS
jgi:TRAP-type C4-dicarboxylate transport system permease small subunit